MFWIHGQNFVVEDCDLWSTWSVFHSTGITVPGGTPAALAAPPPIGGRFGLMRRNTIYNGGACHWFDNGRQLIFEENRCRMVMLSRFVALSVSLTLKASLLQVSETTR